MAATLGWGVERRRWLRCAVWHAAVSSIVWLLWQLLFPSITFGKSYRRGLILVPSAWTCFGFFIFQASQLLFLLGEWLITTPQEKEVASLSDVLTGVLKLAWKAVAGSTSEGHAIRLLFEKMKATRDHLSFLFLCGISGFMSLFALTSSLQSNFMGPDSYDFGLRGVSLGLCYACLHLHKRKFTLSFPIIQRRFFFSLKMGIPEAVKMGVKLAMAVLPISEIFVGISHANSGHSISSIPSKLPSWMWHQSVFVAGAFCAVVCWEFCHHLVQVILTRRHIFAPALGSPVAESQPSEQLLMVLEEADNQTLIKHLASLDLCIVSESNVDTWRREALFEETGETYKSVIGACLRPLDDLTLRLAKGLETFKSEKAGESLKQPPGGDKGPQGGIIKETFRDFQLCAWCAKSAASLTAMSRTEDRYGVAQLSGCNIAVLSSLLSCLLVVEVYLGRRSSSTGASLAGPNSIKWTMPSRGAYIDIGRRKGFPFGKRKVMHKKAYAIADVLSISIHQIVSVFGEEMVVGSGGVKGVAIAERDWLSQKKTLYGSREMHLRKLEMFLNYRVS